MTALICNPLDVARQSRMSSAMQHWLSKPKSSYVEDSWLIASGFIPLASPVLDNGTLIQIAQADINTIDQALNAASHCLEQGHIQTIPVNSKRQWVGQLLRQLDAFSADLIQLEHVVTRKSAAWIQQHDLPLAKDLLRQAQHSLETNKPETIKNADLVSHHCPTTSELEGLTYYQTGPNSILVAPIEPGHSLLDTLSAIAVMISSGCPLILHGRPHHALTLLYIMDLITQLPLPKGALQCVISDDEPLWMTLRQTAHQQRPITLMARPNSLHSYQRELNQHDMVKSHTTLPVPQAVYLSIMTPSPTRDTQALGQWLSQLQQLYGYPGQGPHLCWVPSAELSDVHRMLAQQTESPWVITLADVKTDVEGWIKQSSMVSGLSSTGAMPLLLVGYDRVEQVALPMSSQATWRRLCILGSDYWLASKLAEQVHADEGWFNDVPTPSRLAQELSEPNHQRYASIHPLSHLAQLSRPRWMHVRL